MKNTISKLFDKTFWKFIIVGVINTLVGTSVMFISYNVFHFSYWISSALNYIVGSIVSYFLNKNFTFQDKGNRWKSVLKFVVNISLCYLIAYSGAKRLVSYILAGQSKSIQENGAMLAGMVFFVGLNYLGQRFFVFKKNEDEENA